MSGAGEPGRGGARGHAGVPPAASASKRQGQGGLERKGRARAHGGLVGEADALQVGVGVKARADCLGKLGQELGAVAAVQDVVAHVARLRGRARCQPAPAWRPCGPSHFTRAPKQALAAQVHFSPQRSTPAARAAAVARPPQQIGTRAARAAAPGARPSQQRALRARAPRPGRGRSGRWSRSWRSRRSPRGCTCRG